MRSLLRALAGVAGAALFNAVAAMVVGVFTARLLGPAGHGELSYYLTIASIVALLVNCGSGTALRVLAKGSPTLEASGTYASLSLIIGVTAGGAVPLVVAITRGQDATVGLLTGLAVLGLLTAIARQMQEYLQAHAAVLASVANVGVGHLARLAATGILLLIAVFDVGAGMWALCIGTAAQVLSASRVASRRGFFTPLAWDAGWIRRLVRTGLRAMGFAAGLTVMQRAGRLLLVALAGDASAGLFVAAGTLAESVRMLSTSAGQVLFVRASSGMSGEGMRGFVPLVLGIQVAAGVVLWLLAPWLVDALYGPAFAGASELLRGLLVAEMFMGLALMDSRVLMGGGAVGAVSLATLFAAVTAVGGLVCLIPPYGALGAVIASVIAYSTYALCLRLLIFRGRVCNAV